VANEVTAQKAKTRIAAKPTLPKSVNPHKLIQPELELAFLSNSSWFYKILV
jgi:hypothetical protein